MRRLNSVTLAPAAVAATNIAQSQSPSGAGSLTLNGSVVTAGVATLDIPRRVYITSGGNDTGRTFVVSGTNRYGNTISESVTGANGAAANTLKDYKTVTSVTIDAASAGTVTVGTGGIVSSQWFPLDYRKSADLGIGCIVTGTINYTIEQTFDDPYSYGVGVSPTLDTYLTPFAHATIASKTANFNGTLSDASATGGATAVRLTINSYSTGATVKALFVPGPAESS